MWERPSQTRTPQSARRHANGRPVWCCVSRWCLAPGNWACYRRRSSRLVHSRIVLKLSVHQLWRGGRHQGICHCGDAASTPLPSLSLLRQCRACRMSQRHIRRVLALRFQVQSARASCEVCCMLGLGRARRGGIARLGGGGSGRAASPEDESCLSPQRGYISCASVNIALLMPPRTPSHSASGRASKGLLVSRKVALSTGRRSSLPSGPTSPRGSKRWPSGAVLAAPIAASLVGGGLFCLSPLPLARKVLVTHVGQIRLLALGWQVSWQVHGRRRRVHCDCPPHRCDGRCDSYRHRRRAAHGHVALACRGGPR